MDKLVTIIVTVYNTAEFLEECLTSITNQVYKNIEIIIVNDGSTDNSSEIIEQYTTADSRCHSINLTENKGVGFARNLGIEQASGDFVYFVDSDDFINEHALDKLVQGLGNKTYIMGRTKKLTNKEDSNIDIDEHEVTIRKRNKVFKVLQNLSVLNSLFSMEIIRKYNLRFSEETDCYTEIAFLLPLYKNRSVIYQVKESVYFRRLRNDPITNPSLMQQDREKILKDFLTVYNQLKAELKGNNKEQKLLDKLLIHFYRSKFILIMRDTTQIDRNFEQLATAMEKVSPAQYKNQNLLVRGELKALRNHKLKSYKRAVSIHHFGRESKQNFTSKTKLTRQIYKDILQKRPLNEKKIVFESFLGKNYADSPKYIYEYMVKHYPEYEFVWSFNETNHDIPGNAKQVKRLSLAYYYHMATAKYWVSNMRQPLHLQKREGNVFLQTWHGTPLKKLVFDMDEVYSANPKYKQQFYEQSRLWDYLIAANSYSSDIFKSAFKFDKVMLEDGYPRNDTLYINNNSDYITKMKTKLNIPLDKKVILYAPTWRDDEFYEPGKYKFNLKFDLQKMQEKFGEEYVILLRMHYFIADDLNINGYEGFVYNMSKYDDIAELYLISDILITDYSSVFFDYSNLRRPILFYTYDLEKYRDQLRGFYIDIENEVPGPLVKTTDEIIDAVLNIDKVTIEYKEKYDVFYDKICSWESGKATEKIVKKVFKNH
ncbi:MULTISPECIES: CDP-glycerol:glycerophosphate glycerophosphotransferase [unclassified Viridibacillus]|uniref:bifunctional glycosyltransferase/CDP-glycerol:glycerophosphate glycerophosphotransferase n=1 Tax=unclassified Viridibacillus TaxID=2617942 RepID=UPI00096D9ACF|nr:MULTISPECIES: CDP-glycerol:glycerophosphate glycerophosphotransferase [unclassified Viridibacillus]OMC80232.1 teichoic acid biosynthesis protein F [Viridibacillus sp. FSL H8-0123]OMC81569.1 teichoic acid biosynthesis protein F [Viridibacillus sp. FSL H7-0596]